MAGFLLFVLNRMQITSRQREKQGTLPKTFLPNFSIIFWNFGGGWRDFFPNTSFTAGCFVICLFQLPRVNSQTSWGGESDKRVACFKAKIVPVAQC